MTSTEIVWVYGASAAGKETFIRTVLGREPAVLQEFGWQDKRIGVCEESIRWVSRYPNDDVPERERFKLAKIIPHLASRYDVVLVKGQDKDLALGTPVHVKHALPSATHHVVFVDVGLDELYQRIIHKPWWNKITKRAEEEGWLEEQLDRLHEMQNDFRFTIVDGRAIGHYEEEDTTEL